MLRGIFFDFYGVWAPDRFAESIAIAERANPALANEFREIVDKYFLGLIDLEFLTTNFRMKLGNPNIDVASFAPREADLLEGAVKFIQYLHTHFVKVGILANLGRLEYDLLRKLDSKFKLFESITGSCSLSTPLLNREVFVKAFQTIGEPKDACLIVTANEPYLKFAASLGIKTLKYEGFPKLSTSVEQLLQQ